MVTIQSNTMYDSIVDGIKKAKELVRPILVSSSTLLEVIDPLNFYAAGKFLGSRFYWREPENGYSLVGLGAAVHLETDETSSNRFEIIENQWNELLENAIQDTNNSDIGPFLFGGFSFDPKKMKTTLWRDFPEAKLFIPKYMLTVSKGKTWLTANFMVDAMDKPERVMNDISLEQEMILKAVPNKIDISIVHDIKEEEVEPEAWLQSIKEVISHIQEGILEKAVLARELKLVTTSSFDVEIILNRLQEAQSNSFIFAFESSKSTFIGATPERLIKKENNTFYSTCLAGSIKRGQTVKEDEQLEHTLLHDHKNLSEHQFVVDMIAREMQQVCKRIHKPQSPIIYKAKDIQHLYTPISGEAKDGVSLFSILKSLHPTPALGGFPQEKSLEEIRNVEILDRGWYAGPIGWIDGQGNGEFAVAIRSGLVQENTASLFAGCGIVAESDPEKEYEETQIKFKPMLTAIGGMVDER